MTKYLYTFFISIILGLSLQAQPPNNSNSKRGGSDFKQSNVISGTVIDQETGHGLEFATVTIIDAESNVVITGGLTELDGNFSIPSKPGKYKAKIEFLSYETFIIDDVLLEKGNQNLSLGEIFLTLSGQVIDGVEVRADRSETIFKLDKRVFSVGKDLANKGGSAQDVLDNVPSVSVDIDGNVNLRGSGNVRMLINGQPSTLVSAGNKNGLRSIQASSIDRIEVITNPSAKYESEGMAGLINIILKKETEKGFNGSFNAGIGLPLQYNAGAQVNFRKNKTNFFVNVSSGLRRSPGGGIDSIRQLIGEEYLITIGDEDRDRKGINNRVQAGLDYNLTDNQIITFSGSFGISEDNNENSVNYYDFTEIDGIIESFARTNRLDLEKEDELQQEYNIKYTNEFDGKGNSLVATIQYDDSGEIEFSNIQQGNSLENLLPLQEVNIDENQNNKLAQIDYTYNLSGGYKLESGLRANLRTITNKYSVFDNVDSNLIGVDSLTDDFEYHEDIYAAYGTLGKSWDKFSLQLGLRIEHTSIRTSFQNHVESDTSYNYTRPFPTAHLTYSINDKNAIQISYSRRIVRPRFWYLNPFLTLTDQRNRFEGNPKLLPEFTDSYELGHINYFEKGSLSTSLFYKNTTDIISRIRTIYNDGTSVTIPVNLDKEISYGLDVSMNYDVAEWLKLDGNILIYNYETTAGDFINTFDTSDLSYDGRVGTRFKFWNNAEAQIRLNYRGPRNIVQGLRKSMYFFDVGISKDFLNNNLTITLSSRDILNTRKRRWIIDLPDYFAESEFQWRGRTIELNASYRINQKKKRGGNRGNYQGGGGF